MSKADEVEELNRIAKKHDEKWDEVMKIAKKNGFITQSFSGAAILITNENQIQQFGYEEYQKIQKMNGCDLNE